MSTRARKISYRCDNDCRMEGCPGHVLTGTLQDTSDVVIIEDEKGTYVFSGDINRTNALIDILSSLDYNDASYFPRITPLT